LIAVQFIFWLCLFLILYTYLFYPMILFLCYSGSQICRDWHYLTTRRDRRVSRRAGEEAPFVSFLVAAYNEECCLAAKIANLQRLDYPADKIEIIFVSDGSTDRTNDLLRAAEGPQFRVVVLPQRKGKANALNQAVQDARGKILVFSDASTLFAADAVRNLVRHFSDHSTGVVCGALEFEGTEESKQTDGVYWKYESMLRLMEARLGATLTASGAIYALRRDCFQPLPPGSVIEDFLIPMNARKQGCRVLYDPEAIATEFAAESVKGEFTRRVRLAVGSFRALGELIRVPMRGFTVLAFISHKLLRWAVPFLLIGMLLSNVILVTHRYYGLLLIGQLLFYLWAALGFLFHRQMGRVRFALVGYFLLAMNLAFLVGFYRYLLGRQEVKWQRVR
jgi:cellulose synthase/poly-beta-1,6-N-acetylglucosamine synthase-like glycosyltransferase